MLFKNGEADSLISAARGSALRAICAARRQHFQGLAAAARASFPGPDKNNIKLRKKLVALDIAYHVARHISCPSSEQLLVDIQSRLRQEGAASSSGSSLPFSGDAAAGPCSAVSRHVDLAAEEFEDEGIAEGGKGVAPTIGPAGLRPVLWVDLAAGDDASEVRSSDGSVPELGEVSFLGDSTAEEPHVGEVSLQGVEVPATKQQGASGCLLRGG